MIRRTAAGLALACALTTGAQAQDLKAEVIHWWTSGGESAAVRVFAEQYTKAGGTWIDTAIAGGANARTAAINRTVGGNPPTAMQFNTGKQFDDLVEADLLANVDAVAAEGHWKDIMPAAITAAVTRNGHVYAVPVNIHGQNWLFASNAALAKVGAPMPKNWTELFATMDKMKAAGLTALAFGDQKTWERGLFNTTLGGVGGGDMFIAFWGKHDVGMVKSQDFRKVAESFRKLRTYVDAGAPGRNWNDATTMVIQGKAGFQFMGDWAKGEFTAANQVAGKDYDCTVLGDHGTPYMLGGDVFAMPKNPKAVAAQTLLAKTLLDPVTQIEFAKKKGSIPVRLDLDVSSLDACAQKATKWLADKSTQIPANELLSPPAMTGAVEDIVSQFWNDPSVTTDAFVTKIAAALSAQY